MLQLLFLFLLLSSSAARQLSIVDQNGTSYTITPKQFKGISIYGLETNLRNTVCSWKHPADYYIEKLHELGFNSLRIPLSVQYLVEANYDILDRVVLKAGSLDMQVYLDIHRVANAYQQENPDKGIAEFDQVSNRDEFMNLITTLLSRYFHDPTVVAILSWNEYTGTDINYKKDWDTQFFNVVEKSFPGRFLLVATGLLWGGLLVGYSLEHLPYSDRILYSTHKYHFSPPANPGGWDASFGSVWPANKIIVGEWGFR